jgi:hypothetical protein
MPKGGEIPTAFWDLVGTRRARATEFADTVLTWTAGTPAEFSKPLSLDAEISATVFPSKTLGPNWS